MAVTYWIFNKLLILDKYAFSFLSYILFIHSLFTLFTSSQACLHLFTSSQACLHLLHHLHHFKIVALLQVHYYIKESKPLII